MEFAVDVDNHVSEVDEGNNSTSVAVDVVAPTNNGGTEAPTWNTYLDYLDSLANAGSNAQSGVSCGLGVANPKDPSYILGCLGIMADSDPAVGAILNAAGCGLGANIPACLGTSLDGLRVIVFTIREAARINPNLAAFLETRMY